MSWFSKKKQSPPKKKPLTLNDISILLAKTKEYINIDKQKKVNECYSQEQRLLQMLKAPQRNRKDEEIQILKIGNILNQIEAYEKAAIIVANLDSMKGQVTACNGDASKIQQVIPYVASICFYIEKANDLRGAVDLKLRMNEYFNCDVANTYERAVDPEARRLFSPINIQSPVVLKYAQDFSKKYTIFDVPGLPFNPIQPSHPSSGFPSPYPSNGGYPQSQQGGYPQNQQGGYPQNQAGGYPQNQAGGYPQNQQGMYPQQQMQSSNNYPQQQMNNGQQGLYPQQNGFPGQGNQGGQQQQNSYPIQTFNNSNSLSDPYSQLKGPIYQNNPNQYLPQITQPNIGMANRSSSNFDYPSLSKIIKPPEQNADTFVPLQPPQPNNNEQVNPFAALDQLKNLQMKELPSAIPSQQNLKSNNQQQNNPNLSQNQYINQQQSINNQQQNSQFPSQNQQNNQQQQQNNNQLQSQNSNNPYINLQQKNDQSVLYNPLSQLQQKGAQNSQLNQYQNLQSYNIQGNNDFNSFTPGNQQQGSLGQQMQQPSQMTGSFKQNELQSQNLAHLKNPLDSNIGGMVETKTLNEENGSIQSQVVGQALTNHDLRSLGILRAFCLDGGQQIQDSKQIIEMILREI